MAFRALCVALLLCCLPIAGCGTVANLVRPGPEQGGKAPFGGVKQDVTNLKKAANGECVSQKHPNPEQHPQVARMVFYAADLPFSAIGDVVTWPYVKTYSYINQPVPIPPLTMTTAEPPPQPFVPPTKPSSLFDAKPGQ